MDLFNTNISDAVISDCEKYRYSLTRIWNPEKPQCLFVMLNPSTADANIDDHTIKRCIGFAESSGFGGFHVVNLFALRSTEPKFLLQQGNPIGPDNLKYISDMASKCETIICAWGNPIIVERILKLYPNYKPLEGIPLEKLHYIDLTFSGCPKHPLYLPAHYNFKPVLNVENIKLV